MFGFRTTEARTAKRSHEIPLRRRPGVVNASARHRRLVPAVTELTTYSGRRRDVCLVPACGCDGRYHA